MEVGVDITTKASSFTYLAVDAGCHLETHLVILAEHLYVASSYGSLAFLEVVF